MIIGLAGTFASGKDTLANHLVTTRGFMHVSTSDMVRAVSEAEYGNIERPTLFKAANETREKRGAGIFADLALERFKEEQDKYTGIVVSGVRSLGEAEAIKQAGGKLIFVDSPMEIRYERIKARQRSNEENLTFEQFKKSEEDEELTVHDNPYVQDLTGVREMADILLFNQGDIEAYLKEAEQKLGL